MHIERRTFLKQASLGAMVGCFPASLSGIERTSGPLERRALGRTGERLSIIGFGGIVVMNATPAQAADRVAHAIDRGVNYFDVAPSYGNAEAMLGPALAPYRKHVFLACKTEERTKDGASRELEESLGRLRTDHVDLYQLHAVTSTEDVRTILGPGGALEAFAFDTILFPVNFATWHAGHFGPQVLEAAARKQMGILALKAMARRPWPEGARKTHEKCWYEPLDDAAAAAEGLRFTLSHPVTAAIPPGDENLFALALDLAAGFQPLSASEAEAIKQKGLATTPIFRS
jgi:predicted aldo/keto reductase-like oxidoreductase